MDNLVFKICVFQHFLQNDFGWIWKISTMHLNKLNSQGFKAYLDVFLFGKAKNKPQYEQLDKTDSDQSETSKYTHNKYMIKLK